jgi:hypothetical protein
VKLLSPLLLVGMVSAALVSAALGEPPIASLSRVKLREAPFTVPKIEHGLTVLRSQTHQTPQLQILKPGGEKHAAITFHVEGFAETVVEDAQIQSPRGDGWAAGLAAAGPHRLNGFIASFDAEGNVGKVFLIDDFVPRNLTIGRDGSIWLLGASYGEKKDEIPTAGSILRKYSPDGKERGRFLDATLFSNDRPKLHHVTDFKSEVPAFTFIGSMEDRIYVYLSIPGEWLELDFDGKILKRTVLCASDCQQPQPSFLATIGTKVFSWSQSPENGLFQLNDSRTAWVAAATKEVFQQPYTGGIYGVDGTRLIYARTDEYLYEFLPLQTARLALLTSQESSSSPAVGQSSPR